MIDGDFIIIPRILFNDKSLNETDKILLGLITSLTLKYDYCFASNSYLANYINKSKRTISYSMSKLKKLNYIKIKYIGNNRKIFLNSEKIPKKTASTIADNRNNSIANDCNYKINNKNNKRHNITNYKRTTPYWFDHDEVCDVVPISALENEELNNILNDVIND